MPTPSHLSTPTGGLREVAPRAGGPGRRRFEIDFADGRDRVTVAIELWTLSEVPGACRACSGAHVAFYYRVWSSGSEQRDIAMTPDEERAIEALLARTDLRALGLRWSDDVGLVPAEHDDLPIQGVAS